jgi:hypothetical protein
MKEEPVPQGDEDRCEGIRGQFDELFLLDRLVDPFPKDAAPGLDACREGLAHRRLVADGGPQIGEHLHPCGILTPLQHRPGEGLQAIHAR